MPRSSLLAIVGILVAPLCVQAQSSPSDEPSLPASWVNTIHWRSIGPANMSGRITSIAVYEKDPCIWWAATASGGLLKTTNNGVSFEHQFDREATVSIGDVQVSQSDPNIVWVGTGESNPRNSSSWGNGVYKSTDGGTTWKNMGLNKTFQTGRLAIHPTNPDIVYVGSLGRLWGPNEERGLFKTTDGGATWEKILYVDDKTGVADVQMNPSDPEMLLVAMYERQRDGFDGNDPAKKNGPGSGLYKTTDGGKSFTKLANGLPDCNLGRIGISFFRKDPKNIYIVLESEKTGKTPPEFPHWGFQGQDAEDVGARVTQVSDNGPATEAGMKEGDLVLSLDGELVHSYTELLQGIQKKVAGDKIKLQLVREQETIDTELTLAKVPEAATGSGRGGRGGGGFRGRGGRGGGRVSFDGGLGGQRENMQDYQNPDGYQYGGVYHSADAGETWTRINSANPRPMYYSQIRVDPSDSNHIWVLGTSLYRTEDGGKEFSSNGASRGVHVDHHSMWVDPRDGRHVILGNDGGIYVTWDRGKSWDHHNHVAIGQFYHVGVDSRRNYNVYGGLQDNGSWGGPSRVRNDQGPVNTDWIRVGGGDGFVCLVDPTDPDWVYTESQGGSMSRLNLRTGERGSIRPTGGPGGGQRGGGGRGGRYRFNWKTPFTLSRHNPKIFYTAGNYVFRSIKQGSGMKAISPEVTLTENGSGSAITESPVAEGVVYAGTTDGGVWVTRDDGQNWTQLYGNNATDDDAVEEAAEAVSDEQPAAGVPQRDGADGDDAESGEAQEPPPRQQPPQRGGRGGGAAFVERMMERDANGDGKIQASELPEQMAQFMERLDANGDGELDKSELETLARQGFGGRGGQGRGGAGRGGRGGQRPQQGGNPPAAAATREPPAAAATQEPPAAAATQEPPAAAATETEPAPVANDRVTGKWSGRFLADNFPPDRALFTLELKLSADGKVTGTFDSPMSGGEVTGTFDASKNTVTMTAETERAAMVFSAELAGRQMGGSIDINDGAFTMDFEAERTTPAVATTAAAAGSAGAAAAQQQPAGKSLNDLLPGPRWVSSLEASRFEAGRCYITFDGHRSNDDEPYVFATEDFGQTWRSIRANLPTSAGSTRVVREDIQNPNVLLLGTEFACWVSIDRGNSWTKLNSNLPTVAVHELAIHPNAGEVVAATHGRSLWIADISALRQLSPEIVSADAHLFKPHAAVKWHSLSSRGNSGTRRFVGENPPSGAQLYFSLGTTASEVSLMVCDATGGLIREFTDLPTDAGLHRVAWDLRRATRGQQAGGGRGGFGGGRGRGGFGRGSTVSTGTYMVKLVVDGQEFKEEISVVADPDYPEVEALANEYQELFDLLMGTGDDGDD